jgi:hypothetical protein
MLTGKTIGDLSLLTVINDDVKVPVEASGTTYHINFSSIIHRAYGGYSSYVDQPLLGVQTPTIITFESIDIEVSVLLVDNSKLTIVIPGVYEFGISLQLDKDSVNVGSGVFFWVNIDGVPVPGTAGEVRLLNNVSESLPFIPYVFDLLEGQYVEFVFASDDASIYLKYIPEETVPYLRPASPSATLAVKQIG